MKKLNEAISFLRKENNWNKTELAEKLHCSVATITNLEHGRRIPSLPFLVRIAKTFKVEVSHVCMLAEMMEARPLKFATKTFENYLTIRETKRILKK